MQKILRLVLLLALVVAFASCAGATPRTAATPTQSLQYRMRDFHLRSGLRIVVEEDHSAPLVGVVNVVGVGATSDPPGKEGLAHLVEHLTFRAKQAPRRSVWSLFDQAGAAYVNAETSWDTTVYHEVGPRDLIVDFLTLEGLRIVDPLAGLDEATFATEREVVRNELRQHGETWGAGAAIAAVQRATFPAGHPYARPAIGTHETLSALTLEDARAFVKAHYRPSNMTMLVIGDVKLEGFEKVLDASLAGSLNQPTGDVIVRGSRLPAQAPEPPAPPPSAGLTTIEGNVTAPELYLAWSLPRGFAAESYLGALARVGTSEAIAAAAAIDADIVGGSVSVAEGMQASLLVAQVILRAGDHPEASARRVVDQLYRSWAGADDEPPQVAETRFVHQRARIASTTLLDAENIGSRGIERAEFTHFSGDPSLFARKIDALAQVDRSKLAAFHRQYVNRDRVRVVLVKAVPAERRAPEGRTGIADPGSGKVGSVTYDVASIAKIAVPVGLQTAFQRDRLPNGLTIEAARHGTTPMVTIGMRFGAGTSEEAEPGAIAMAQNAASVGHPLHGQFDDHGALFNESWSADAYQLRVRVPSSQLAATLTILAERVASLRVHSDAMRWFDESVLPYIRRDQARPDKVAERAFRRALFAGHRFGNVNEMPADSRPGIDAANEWLASVLNPSRATLAIAGDIDPPEALRLVKDAFGGWSGGGASEDPPALGETGIPREIVTHRPGATQAEIKVGCRLPSAGPIESVQNDVMAKVLSARLGGAIRQQLGVSYGFYAAATTLRGGTATLQAWGTVENAGLARALGVIRAELAGADDWRDADLDPGRWAVARSYNFTRATPDDWVAAALTAEGLGWGLGAVDGVPKALALIDRAKLVAPLKRCADGAVISIVGDETVARRALAEAWPSAH